MVKSIFLFASIFVVHFSEPLAAEDALVAEAAAYCEIFQLHVDNQSNPRITRGPVIISDEARNYKEIAVQLMVQFMRAADEAPSEYITVDSLMAPNLGASMNTDNTDFNAGIWYAKSTDFARFLIREGLPSNAGSSQLGAAAQRLLNQHHCENIMTINH